jgi:hypothetical protein
MIYTFCLGRHSAVATAEYLQIGCEKHDWDTFFQRFEELGKVNQYTDVEISRYRAVANVFYELLRGTEWGRKNDS